MFYKQMKNVLLIFFWFTCLQAFGFSGRTTLDQVTTRANTLSDDADDLQKQLDNEAKDRLKFGRPQTIWILHYPTKHRYIRELTQTQTTKRFTRDNKPSNKLSKQFQRTESQKKIYAFSFSFYASKPEECWNYTDQAHWYKTYPSCSGTRQSPVNLPYTSLMVHTKAYREMLFSNYEAMPCAMTMLRDKETATIIGDWTQRPFVYGGAAHSRRYVFHSLAIRRPSEHTIGGLYYPMETQALHVSVEYPTIEAALNAASRDKSALLIVANIYKYSDRNHKGLKELVQTLISPLGSNMSLNPLPLQVLSPALREYAAYHGSLTIPPCTEAVLWLVRARALPISRGLAEILEKKTYCKPGQSFRRLVQPLNDRKVYYFN